jgi:GT2 family glycosyltransferase
MNLHIIMACHNRRESTLRCIQSAQDAARMADLNIDITLYDDGSRDSTAEFVSARFPATKILAGTGSEYWAKSMAIAEASALETIRSEGVKNSYIVWLNDDVVLDIDAFERLANLSVEYPEQILVGAMRDPDSFEVTYSGLRRSGLHPLNFELCPLSSTPAAVEIFNGNLVLVPASLAETIGGIDGGYSHALADIDYGFRARLKSINVVLAPGSLGTCARNPVPPSRPIATEWKHFIGPKGSGNPKSMIKILRLAAPRSWVLYGLASYGLWWMRRISGGLRAISFASRTKGRAL